MTPKQSVQLLLHAKPHPPNIRSPSPVTQPPQANIIKTDQDDFCLHLVYRSYPCTNPDEMQDLRATVMLQDWQLDPEIMETNGGQALAS